MKKLLKTKKLEVKTETVRTLTDKQLDGVGGGFVVPGQSTTNSEPRCQVYTQV